MTQSLPEYGPSFIKATRPTSTNRLYTYLGTCTSKYLPVSLFHYKPTIFPTRGHAEEIAPAQFVKKWWLSVCDALIFHTQETANI